MVFILYFATLPTHTNILLLKNVFLPTTDREEKRWLQSGWTKIERWEAAAEAEREEDEGRATRQWME